MPATPSIHQARSTRRGGASARPFAVLALAAATVWPLCATQASSPTGPYTSYTVIYRFYTVAGNMDGFGPMSGLVADAQGQLYGTTEYGGAFFYGTVFRLTPPSSGSGSWTETILHSFDYRTEGGNPVAPVTLGADGTIYGTTLNGGVHGAGTVFGLANAPSGTLKVLHTFLANQYLAAHPNTGLVFGSDGLLYGTTSSFAYGVNNDMGTDFRVSPFGDTVEFQQLNTFGQVGNGFNPEGLITAPQRYFNGFVGATNVTNLGISYNDLGPGTVYGLKVYADGGTADATLYSFNSTNDLANPVSTLLAGKGSMANLLFGCTSSSSFPQGGGGIYSLAPNGSGGVTETVLNLFAADKRVPVAVSACNLVQADAAGTLLFTTDFGGGPFAGGGIFQLTPPATPGGAWTEQENVELEFPVAPHGPLVRVGPNYFGTLAGSPPQNDSGGVFELLYHAPPK